MSTRVQLYLGRDADGAKYGVRAQVTLTTKYAAPRKGTVRMFVAVPKLLSETEVRKRLVEDAP
jgi:hypothetical protein